MPTQRLWRAFVALAVLLSTIVAVVPAPAATAAPPVFAHPGVLNSTASLDFVRAKVNSGAQPWKSAYDSMMASQYGSLTRAPHPRAVVECGPTSNPNIGCTDERQDAIAAYTMSLAWYVTRDARYAQKAIAIMDAWSAVITGHTNSNARLQTGWAGAVWPRAAEIIRHTYTSWPNVNRFATMLRNVYLPVLMPGATTTNGNWELVMMEAAIGISVFLDDAASYDRAMAKFRARVPAFIYLTSDGSLPRTVAGGPSGSSAIIAYWHGQSTFMNGLTQETCRDFTHTGYGIASIEHVAETSRIQGSDLYTTDVGERLRHALGMHSGYQLGNPMPSNLCGGTRTGSLGPVTEVGFNALNTRLGIAMTNNRTLTLQRRPSGSDNLFVAWQTLTHAANPA
ncbi:MAG: alginate lyase family protein [Kibdelosporangium sp.]